MKKFIRSTLAVTVLLVGLVGCVCGDECCGDDGKCCKKTNTTKKDTTGKQ